MPVTYKYDKESNTINTHTSGILTAKDIRQYFMVLYDDDDIQTKPVEIVHFNKLEDIMLGYKESRTIRSAYWRVKDKHKITGTVFVVDSTLAFGIARMLQMLLSEINHPITIEDRRNEKVYTKAWDKYG